jgi:bacterioferritin-associated ferredoxin
MKSEDIIICRCQDITLKEIEKAVDAGITEPEQLKRFLHIGMGPCQGRTCGRLVTRIIAHKTGKPVSEIKSTHQRPPLVTIPIHEFLGEDHE